MALAAFRPTGVLAYTIRYALVYSERQCLAYCASAWDSLTYNDIPRITCLIHSE